MANRDKQLEGRIQSAQQALQAWAIAADLWHDSGFQTYAERVDGEPGDCAVVFIMYSGGNLGRLLDEDYDPRRREEFDQIAEQWGFFLENVDGHSFNFFATDEHLQIEYDEYFHWKWVCSLIVEDFGDLYAELYQYFHAYPDRLYSLRPREFEILLYRIFQNQGFEAHVGPGTGDGGVDVRLLQRGALGDTLAYVQAKRYAPSRPINLEAVAALRGVMANDGVERGIIPDWVLERNLFLQTYL
jgi:hypothetical protein